MFTQNDLEKVLEKEPKLGKNGLKTTPIYEFEFGDDKFIERDFEEIEYAIKWLKNRTQSKTFNKKFTSYGLKHFVEREYLTYISNGSFIAAVIHLGLSYKKIEDSPNIYIKMNNYEVTKNDERLPLSLGHHKKKCCSKVVR